MIKHWLLTGDTHGHVMERISKIPSCYEASETALIILGDAGINFYLNKTDAKNKKIINNTGFTLYLVRGNHEERPENLPNIRAKYDTEVNGFIYYEEEFPNIRYFADGCSYKILDKSVLVIGGAYSVDKWYRLQMAGIMDEYHPDYKNPHKTGWFPDEQLNPKEMNDIISCWEGEKFDIILTHTYPISWEPTDLFITGLDQSKVDKTMEKFLEEVKEKVDWGIWLFGHHHSDRLVRPFVEMLFMDIEDLAHIIERWERPDQIDWWLEKDPNYYMGV